MFRIWQWKRRSRSRWSPLSRLTTLSARGLAARSRAINWMPLSNTYNLIISFFVILSQILIPNRSHAAFLTSTTFRSRPFASVGKIRALPTTLRAIRRLLPRNSILISGTFLNLVLSNPKRTTRKRIGRGDRRSASSSRASLPRTLSLRRRPPMAASYLWYFVITFKD